MKKPIFHTLFIVLMLGGTTLDAQSAFTQARWTKPGGVQQDILVEYKNWDAAPVSIRYKNREGENLRDLLPEEVQELRILTDPEEIYIGRETQVAIFSKDISISQAVRYQRKTIFLRALVLGTMNLYLYQDESNVNHYFIERDTLWDELIYHEYYTDKKQNLSRFHHRFRAQLLRATYDCPGPAEKINRMVFGEKTLTGIVMTYNSSTCNNQLRYPVPGGQKRKTKFRLGLRAGGIVAMNKIEFEFGSKYSGKNTSFNPVFGIDGLFFLPRGNKAVLLEALYDRRKYKTTLIVPTYIREDYLQTHLAVRQYWPDRPLKPFLSAGLLYGFPLKKEISEGWTVDYSPPGQSGVSFGGGVRWNKVEVETRFIMDQLLSLKRGGVSSSLGASFSVGYWIN